MGSKEIQWLTHVMLAYMSPLESRQTFQTDQPLRIIPQRRQVCLRFDFKLVSTIFVQAFGAKTRKLTPSSGDKGQPKESCKAERGTRIKRAPGPVPTVDHFDNDAQEFTILKTSSPFPSDDNWKEPADGKGFALQQTVSLRRPLSSSRHMWDVVFSVNRQSFITSSWLLLGSAS